MTPEEILRLVENYDSQEKLAATGFQLAGQKYFYLSGNDDVMRGKQGKGGVHVVKTHQVRLE